MGIALLLAQNVMDVVMAGMPKTAASDNITAEVWMHTRAQPRQQSRTNTQVHFSTHIHTSFFSILFTDHHGRGGAGHAKDGSQLQPYGQSVGRQRCGGAHHARPDVHGEDRRADRLQGHQEGGIKEVGCIANPTFFLPPSCPLCEG